MELQITSKEELPLLSRTRVKARITFKGATPTKQEAIVAFAKALNAEPNLIIIRQIKTAFGEQSAEIFGYLYKDRKSLETIEQKSMVKKNRSNKKEEPKDEAEKPAETTNEKDQSEQKKDEAKEKEAKKPEAVVSDQTKSDSTGDS